MTRSAQARATQTLGLAGVDRAAAATFLQTPKEGARILCAGAERVC